MQCIGVRYRNDAHWSDGGSTRFSFRELEGFWDCTGELHSLCTLKGIGGVLMAVAVAVTAPTVVIVGVAAMEVLAAMVVPVVFFLWKVVLVVDGM